MKRRKADNEPTVVSSGSGSSSNSHAWVASLAAALATTCTPLPPPLPQQQQLPPPAPVEWPSAEVLLTASAQSRRAYFYHLRLVVSTVVSHPHTRGLLSPAEASLAARFLDLSLPAASLLARLSGRRGPWFLAASFNNFLEVVEAPDATALGTKRPDASSEGAVSDADDDALENDNDAEGDAGAGEEAREATSSAEESSSSSRPPSPALSATGRSHYDRLPWTPATWGRLQAALTDLISGGMLLGIPSDSDIAALAKVSSSSFASSASSSSTASAFARLAGVKRPRAEDEPAQATSVSLSLVNCVSPAHTQLSLVLEAARAVLSTPESEALALRLGVKLTAAQATAARTAYNQKTAAMTSTGSSSNSAAVGAESVTRGVTDTKSLVFEALARRVLTQRTVAGGFLPVSKELVRMLHSKLPPLEPDAPVAEAAVSTASATAAAAVFDDAGSDDDIAVVEEVSGPPATPAVAATPWWKKPRPAPSPAPAPAAATPGTSGTKVVWVAGKPRFVPAARPTPGSGKGASKGGAVKASPAGGNSSGGSGSGSAAPAGYGASDHLLVRLHPDWTSFVRIVYTLFYVATGTAHLSSGMGTGNWPVIPLAAPPAPPPGVALEAAAGAGAAAAADSSSSGVIDLLDDEEEGGTAAAVSNSSLPRSYPLRPVLMSAADVLASAQAAAQGWGPGSGSRYADLGATKDTYLPRGAGAGAGNVFLAVPVGANGNSSGGVSSSNSSSGASAPVARFARSDNGGSAPTSVALITSGMGAAGTSLNTLYSPGLLHVFRRVDFAPVACLRAVQLFPSRDHLRALGAAHVFRAQVDVSGVLGLAPFDWKLEESSDDEEAGCVAAASSSEAVVPAPADTDISIVELLDSQASQPAKTAAVASAPAVKEDTGPRVAAASSAPAPSGPTNTLGWAVPVEARKVQQLLPAPAGTAPLSQHCMGLQLLPYAPLLCGATVAYSLEHWKADFAGAAAAVPLASVLAVARGITQQETSEGDCAAVQPEFVGASACAFTVVFCGELLAGDARSAALLTLPATPSTAAAIATSPAPVKVALRASLCLALSLALDAFSLSPLSRHPWLHQYCPGSLFATILWEAVDPLERSRRYDLAVLALAQLTTTPFTPHRSGRWYDRLGLDLEHLGLVADALVAVERGLGSPAVRAGERIALMLRRAKLLKKAQAGGAAGKKTAGKGGSGKGGGVGRGAARRAPRRRAVASSSSDDSAEDDEGADDDGDKGAGEEQDGPIVLDDEEEEEEEAAAAPAPAPAAVAPAPSPSPPLKLPNLEDDVRVQELVMNDALAVQAAGTDPELPLFHTLRQASQTATLLPTTAADTLSAPLGGSWNSLAAPVPASPVPLAVDIIDANPLNRDTGVKSRFLSGIDVENDGSEGEQGSDDAEGGGRDDEGTYDLASVPPGAGWVNVTDEVCASFGWTYQSHSPWKPVYKPGGWGGGGGGGWGVDAGSSAVVSRAASPAIAVQAAAGSSVSADEATTASTAAASSAIAADREGAADGAEAADAGAAGATDAPQRRYPWKRYGYRKPWSELTGNRPEDVPSLSDLLSLRISVEALSLARYWLGGEGEAGAVEVPPHLEAPGRGWRGHHCEGVPIYALFALLLWDVLFSPLPDAFLTPYQDGPLDLDVSGVFHRNRLPALTERLTWIARASGAELAATLALCWRTHYGRQARGLRWDAHPLPLLQLLAVGLGGPALAVICDAMAYNHKQCQAGFPDLLLWRVWAPAAGVVSGEAEGASGEDDAAPGLALPPGAIVQVCVVEVKGGSDRLSEKQQHWIRVLRAAGVNVRLCKVATAVGSKRGGGGRSSGNGGGAGNA